MSLLLYILFGALLGLSLGVASLAGRRNDFSVYVVAIILLVAGQLGTIYTAYTSGYDKGQEEKVEQEKESE